MPMFGRRSPWPESLVLVALLLVALTPVAASADEAPVIGTEENPELTDAEDDVEYSPFYVGSEDRYHLDILKAWFEYLPETDQVQTTFLTKDARNLESASGTWDISCRLEVALTDGESTTGHYMSFAFWQRPDDAEIVSSVSEHEGDPGTGTESEILAHEFSATLEEPGRFVFTVDRTNIFLRTDGFDEPEANCREQLSPQAGTTTAIINQDFAASTESYSISDLKPASNATDDDDTLPETSGASSSPASPTRAAASLSVAAFVLAIVAAFAWTRRQSQE